MNMQENGIRGIETIIDASMQRYDVSNLLVKETLHEFPNLRFLLGNVTPEPVGRDKQHDGIDRPIYFLTEGSGMFGLKNPDDAMRWKGIFNHIMGTARQVSYLADRLSSLPSHQIQEFGERGYYVPSLIAIRPNELRDFIFVSHAGHRQADEYTLHGLRDTAHPTGDSGINTFQLLQKEGASAEVLDLMRVEMHADQLARPGGGDHFPNIIDNILTYPDWTFGQAPNTLDERFIKLHADKRASDDVLKVLKLCGASFEKALQEIVDPDIFNQMTHADPYEWETTIRQAYCDPSGLPMATVFPGYIAQYPSLANR